MTVSAVDRRLALRTAGAALAVCLGYYAGANLGFILRFPPQAPSILWPPNAILTATLLLTRPRRWWIYLLAALPAHLAAELPSFPPSLVLLWFITNCSEGVLAASGVRLLNDAPARFDTLRRITVFLVAAVALAPLATSFLDAAAVHAILGEPYWEVWRARSLSNMLTELTVVPTIVIAIVNGPAALRNATLLRRIEAVLLGLVVVTVALWAFLGPTDDRYALPGAPVTPLAFVLPFIVMAAVRFGPGGASASFLATTLVAVIGATHGGGPFIGLPLAESVVALQIVLAVVAIPLGCLAALIEERRRAQAVLAGRLRFEQLLSRLSRAFVNLPSDATDSAFEVWLGHLGQFLGLDRVSLLRLRPDRRLVVVHRWTAVADSATPVLRVDDDLPWAASCLRRDEPVVVSRLRDLPPDAAQDLATLRRLGVRSVLMIPLFAGSTVLGGLAFATTTARREWSPELVQRLRLVGEVFASAVARRDAEDAGRASDLMRSSILDSLSSGVAVLDREGRVIAVNASWKAFAGDADPWSVGLVAGASYLDTCRRAAAEGVAHATPVLEGTTRVLDGSRTSFAFEYCAGPPADRWFAISVGALNRPEGGAIVAMTDVTERKRAELDAQRARHELAHFTRVSTMGELTASLAHELNQPLTGILTNAEAARRFLSTTPPDLGELNIALADIIEDGKRAGDVIQRVREFLRKGVIDHGPLDLNRLIRDVVSLISSDAIIRNVRIALELDPALPLVHGDRVQVQQVVLNLVFNALEAMGEGGGNAARPPVVIRTEREDDHTARVVVEDAAGGIRAEETDAVFDAFYTTKPAGMGMGLAIARSIVEAHRGKIWAANNAMGGATFLFTLPAAVRPL